MAAASWKFDDGQSHPTKCFPAGTPHRRRRDGRGHWLVAYREAEQQKLRRVHRRCEDSMVADTPPGVTFDGPFLLRLHRVEKPSELCSVDISEQNLRSVKPDDFKVFDNVAYIDASINSLSLGSFSSFASLRELNLSLNGICNVTFNAADFPHLKVLDLCYNSLSAAAIISLGRLPRLKVLHLTGNQLHRLPPDLGSSHHDPPHLLAEDEGPRFKALQVLTLDDNKLSSGVFNSLRNLKRLKYLNLQGNRISEIPYTPLPASPKPERGSTAGPAEEEGHAQPGPNPDEHLENTSQTFHKDTWEECCQGSSVPLPQLQFLNLADNKIAKEEALMAAALFPMLREMDVHSNPLAVRTRGEPRPLTSYLQERLGINIKQKETQEVVKLPLTVSTDPKWKVEELPNVWKTPSFPNAACPAQTQADKSQLTFKKATGSEDKSSRGHGSSGNTEHFFITQAADGHKSDSDRPSGETAANEERDGPEPLSRCKPLMDAEPDPHVLKAVGIQTAVRMLQHKLKNLHVYRDSRPRLDSIQTPYRERHKRVHKLPPLKPVKQPRERVDEMIKEVKGSTTIEVVALGNAIHGTGINREEHGEEHEEALSLLRDMKTKYNMVHKRTMEQAASAESDGNPESARAEAPPGQML